MHETSTAPSGRDPAITPGGFSGGADTRTDAGSRRDVFRSTPALIDVSSTTVAAWRNIASPEGRKYHGTMHAARSSRHPSDPSLSSGSEAKIYFAVAHQDRPVRQQIDPLLSI
jgi:hypothetical protein